jgi:hypothetical protein
MTQTAVIQVKANIQQDVDSDLAEALAKITKAYSISLASGTGSGQADMAWSDQRTTDDTGEDLDLAGALTGHLGGTLTFAKLKAVIIKAADANTLNVVVSRPADVGVPLFAAAGDAISVLPGGLFVWVAPGAGVTVTASTGDILHVAASNTGSVTYDVILVGTSA